MGWCLGLHLLEDKSTVWKALVTKYRHTSGEGLGLGQVGLVSVEADTTLGQCGRTGWICGGLQPELSESGACVDVERPAG